MKLTIPTRDQLAVAQPATRMIFYAAGFHGMRILNLRQLSATRFQFRLIPNTTPYRYGWIHGSQAKIRKTAAVCPHGFAAYMAEIFKTYPNAIFSTGSPVTGGSQTRVTRDTNLQFLADDIAESRQRSQYAWAECLHEDDES